MIHYIIEEYLACDDSYLRDCCLSIGKQEFSSIPYDSIVLLMSTCHMTITRTSHDGIPRSHDYHVTTWKESGHIFKSDKRDAKSIAESNKPCSLDR